MSAPTLDNPAGVEGPSLWAGPTALRSVQEVGVLIFLGLCATVTVLTTLGIVVVLGVEAVHFFGVSGESLAGFLFGTKLEPEASPPRFGILPLIWGTMVIAVGSSVIALPIGLLSAIYLSEYAHPRVRSVLKPTLELLAGIPTIVYGYLALLLVTPAIKAVVRPFRPGGGDVQRPERLRRRGDHDHPDGLVA